MSTDNVTTIGRPYAAPEPPSLDHIDNRLSTHVAALRCATVLLQWAAEEPALRCQEEIAAAARVVADAVRGLESAQVELDGWRVSHQEVQSN